MKMPNCGKCDKEVTSISCVPHWPYQMEFDDKGKPLPGEQRKRGDSCYIEATAKCEPCRLDRIMANDEFQRMWMGR